MSDSPGHGESPLTLTAHEYVTALRACYRYIQRAGAETHSGTILITWQLCNDDRNIGKTRDPLQTEDLPYLRIVKPIDKLSTMVEEKAETRGESFHGAAKADAMLEEPEVVESEDDQVIEDRMRSDKPRIQFEIHYHVNYQVPVLYFILLDFPKDKRDLNAVYGYVLSGNWKDTLTEVGIMGGLTYAEMPISGQPCFFVHPCLTAEAVNEVMGGRKILLEDYFQLWLGIVGAPVGIFLPIKRPNSSSAGAL